MNSSPFVSNTQYQNLTPGTYDLLVQDADGCEFFVELNVPAANPLILDIGQDDEVNLGDSLQLSVFTNLIIDSIIWEFDESLVLIDTVYTSSDLGGSDEKVYNLKIGMSRFKSCQPPFLTNDQ